MTPETLCMGCMCERDGTQVCPNCHYRHGSPPDTPLVLQPGTMLTNNYLVGKKLGQGGFGITYIGYDFSAKLRVAIKEYFPREISTRAGDGHTVSPISQAYRADLNYGLHKFEEEARAIAQFRNQPGIVSFLNFFQRNGTAYIVMGYVEGDTLQKYLLQRGNRISFEAALQILSHVMKALEDIHHVNLLHRDISPDNIYIERDGNVRLLDFGAARQAFGEQSRSLSVVLKPGYAPEEQYRTRGRQGPATDIYALGATFYRSITGRVPTESLDRLQNDDLIPPRAMGIQMPQRSETALLKALAVKAENRFQSALEFRNAITPISDSGRVLRVVGPRVLHKPGIVAALLVSFAITLGLNLAGNGYQVLEIFPLLAIFVLMLFMFQRMWKSIQNGHARMKPDKALAFCFIPIFNLYWSFPVMWGFAVDYNRYLDHQRLKHEKLPEGTFLAAAITYVATWILTPMARSLDFFSILIILNAIFLCIAVAKACDAVNALSAARIDQPPGPSDSSGPPAKVLLYGVAGQYQGQQLEIGQQPITIGRNPSRSNLVISSDEISGAHVKVWWDPSAVGIWIEDLDSTNGTFYRKVSSGSGGWTRLSGTTQLLPGDIFQLGAGKAVFEVMAGSMTHA